MDATTSSRSSRRGATPSPHGQSLSDYWILSGIENHPVPQPGSNALPRTDPDYDLVLQGPNGLLSHFRGTVSLDGSENPDAVVRYDRRTGDVHLILTNSGTTPCVLQIANAYSPSEAPHEFHLVPGATAVDPWSLASSHQWFDLSITCEGSPTFLRRFAGHVETGRPSTSDPGTFTDNNLT